MQGKHIFKTAYTGRERSTTECGSEIEEVWGYEIDKFGRKVLVRTGTKNVYEEIQASLEETKIENILKRASMGDNTVFRPDGVYADLTQLPSNLIEARQAMQNLENVWNEVPNDIKAKYHYSVDEFIGASGSDTWLRDMGILSDTKTEVTETEAPAAEAKETANE